jgi:hypothetical protein
MLRMWWAEHQRLRRQAQGLEGGALNQAENQITVKHEIVDGEAYWVGRAASYPDVAVYEDSKAKAKSSLLGVIADLQQLHGEYGIQI